MDYKNLLIYYKLLHIVIKTSQRQLPLQIVNIHGD